MALTDFLRRVILGKKDKFTFRGYSEGMIDFNQIGRDIGIYIHIPFCRTLCPYCPYNKVLYNKELALEYKKGLLREIELYRDLIVGKNITSIYIGGGTPTLLINELGEIIELFKEILGLHGDIGVEVYPTEVNDESMKALREMGVNMISLGVQSFNNERLKFLGRNYGEDDIDRAIKKVREFKFKCLDLDIMTNLPGQSLEEIEYDLRRAYSYDIDQISIYPLIIFPMTNLSKAIKEKNLSRFSEIEEWKILKLIDKISSELGYKRSSIWTYGRDESNRYTSVTRESFIGFGAGASSLFGNYFYLNTFNVEEYIKCIQKNKLPVNLVDTMDEREREIFWIFWRCYDGTIDGERFRELFGKDMKREFRLLFELLRLFKMTRQEGEKIVLTDLGRYSYHYVEKQYSIYYLNNLWKSSMEKSWIEELKL